MSSEANQEPGSTVAWQIEPDEHSDRLARFVGQLRQSEAVRKGLPDSHGFGGENGDAKHFIGAIGECYLAKALDVFWNGSVNTFKSGGDVGGIQVRTRSEVWMELYVRDDDRDDDIFVLVTLDGPDIVIWGWVVARDAKRPEWKKSHGGREPAYFVPKDKLMPMSALRDLLKGSQEPKTRGAT